MRSTENIGMAAFKHDKLVGELDAIETVCFHILKNNINSFIISIPKPEDTGSKIDLLLTPKGDTKIKVDIVNNSPYIKIDGSSNVLNSISNSCNNYLENVLLDYLYKTSIDFKSDINGIGKYALSSFYTNKEFKNYNWVDNYMNSTFKVNINTTVNSGFLLNKT